MGMLVLQDLHRLQKKRVELRFQAAGTGAFMTANMTALDSNHIFTILSIHNNRRFQNCLLFIALFFLFSCGEKKNKQEQDKPTNEIRLTEQKTDSISISVKFHKQGTVGFNIPDKYLNNYYLEFNNNHETDTTITKRIKRHFSNFTFSYTVVKKEKGKFNFITNSFFIGKNTDSISLNYENKNLKLNNKSNELFRFNELTNNKDYTTFNKNYVISGEKDLARLDSLHTYFENTYSENGKAFAAVLNDYYYQNRLLDTDLSNLNINTSLRNLDTIIYGEPLKYITSKYWRENIDSVDFKKLKLEYSPEVNDLLTIELFNFLSFEDHRGDSYNGAKKWLKATDFYKSNFDFVNSKIEPLDSKTFKKRLSDLRIQSRNEDETSIKNVIKANPSEYYLIDFWATWCKPCIAGIKQMDKMNLPENLKVISLSIDYPNAKPKWKKMSKELNQDISYLVVDSLTVNKNFLKFMELQSIPRYVLIDKNMNLIDQAFYYPNEPQFLPKLQDLKNHKYW